MDVYELIEKIGGEVVRGKARVRQGDDYVIVGTITEDGMIFTKDGAELKAALMEASSPKTTKAKAKAAKAEPVTEPEPEQDVLALEEPVDESNAN